MAELDEVFRAVSRAYLEAFVPGNACPDQYVADLGRGPIRFFRQPADQAPTELAPVVLVLESPHNDEYSDRDHPAPANGETGERIKKHLQRVLKRLGDANLVGRPLILVNAIQYQCSLGGYGKVGVPTRFHRDNMFVRMWGLDTNAIPANFRARLSRYVGCHQPFSQHHQGGYVIVNACTKGTAVRQLRMMVEDAVIAALGRQSHIKVEHPSCWKPRVQIRSWRYVAAP